MKKYFKNWKFLFKDLEVWKINIDTPETISFCVLVDNDYFRLETNQDIKIRSVYFDQKAMVVEVAKKYFSNSEFKNLIKLDGLDLTKISSVEIKKILNHNNIISLSYLDDSGDLKFK